MAAHQIWSKLHWLLKKMMLPKHRDEAIADAIPRSSGQPPVVHLATPQRFSRVVSASFTLMLTFSEQNSEVRHQNFPALKL
jgi:hypothetical protein